MCTSCLDADTADQFTLLALQSAGYERVTAFRVDRAARRPQIAVQPRQSAREARTAGSLVTRRLDSDPLTYFCCNLLIAPADLLSRDYVDVSDCESS